MTKESRACSAGPQTARLSASEQGLAYRSFLMARLMPLPLLVALAASLLLLLPLPSVEASSNHLSGSQMYASALTLQVSRHVQRTSNANDEEHGAAL